jgi:hypothetical protein
MIEAAGVLAVAGFVAGFAVALLVLLARWRRAT